MQENTNEKVTFGFWVYLMSDCVLFAALFAAYAVLRGETFGGATIAEITDLPFVLGETFILLTSSFTAGLTVFFATRSKKSLQTFFALAATLVLGAAFLFMEISEFRHLIAEGDGPARSAFLSSFFTLVGTHGLHITLGILWGTVLLGYMLAKGLTAATTRRLVLFSLFWHFLDIVWIFIFTFVYLFGALHL